MPTKTLKELRKEVFSSEYAQRSEWLIHSSMAVSYGLCDICHGKGQQELRCTVNGKSCDGRAVCIFPF